MIKNYLTIAFRNLLRHKTFSLLTILGLSTGMAACFILIQYSLFEMSYDDFHKNGKNIYRLGLSLYNDGKLQTQIPKNFSALGPALKNDLPEVKDYVRVFPIDGTMAIKKNNIVFNEKDILFADASMLQVFSFPVLKGDPLTALKEPYTVVLTESTAKKYFNNEDAIGQQLTIREGKIDVPVTVKAIVKDVPENSHLTFDFLISHATLDILWGERASNSWGEALFYTYILVEDGANGEHLKNKLTPALIERY
ncbi:MAG: cell division protein FtsX, partial [Marivirga sp.]|nr:cell division protein FtsX [Marivirga sp.]